ncbi:MAG: GNAT family N-acetyltransferase [Clostridiales bacterium]|nr:GNAT family N-acetyltransferase [Clostridiales bacterium]
MEYRLATPEDAALICRFVDDQHTTYQERDIRSFLEKEDAKAFLAVDGVAGEAVGFAYGYTLHRPDGRKDFYLHAIDIEKRMQGRGYGTALIRYIDDWRKQDGYRKMFLITNKGNPMACKCYEKAGGITPSDDDVVYMFE